MYQAYPWVVWFIITILFFMWRTDNLFNIVVKTLLLAVAIWSAIEGCERLNITSVNVAKAQQGTDNVTNVEKSK